MGDECRFSVERGQVGARKRRPFTDDLQVELDRMGSGRYRSYSTDDIRVDWLFKAVVELSWALTESFAAGGVVRV